MATQTSNPATDRRSSCLPVMTYGDIETPGSYITLDSGALLRIPVEGLAPGHSPLISITSAGDFRVAKLSDSPSTPITKLRTTAADNDLWVNF